jgi:hypothetical protein
VRAAFKVLSRPEIADEWAARDKHLLDLIKKAKQGEASVGGE